MADLILPVKREYFEQIQRGEKTEEYRLCNHYWLKRLHEHQESRYRRSFERIVITLGYPKADDRSRRLYFPFLGYTVKTITHPHFGQDPVQVYAIKLESAK